MNFHTERDKLLPARLKRLLDLDPSIVPLLPQKKEEILAFKRDVDKISHLKAA
jgi:hypothetical protein